MAPPPAVVIVVRHGARLDAADKQWHLKSPTPYDPPLTYGGWTQCRNLGHRIAALLQTREQIFNAAAQQEEDSAGSITGVFARNRSGKPRKKKHRVIIHSSPFLRCTQTSIAISSGISQYNGLNGHSKFERGPPLSRSRGESSQERPSRPLSIINDEDSDDFRGRPSSPQACNTRLRLRVDAFLGEWLSPEYYESITPPPDSVLMLASAKAELLHRGEPISAEERSPRIPVRKKSSAGLWGSPVSTPTEGPSDIAIEDGIELDGPAHQFPRNRSASHGEPDKEPTSPRLSMRGSFTPKNGYHPPTPLYAISPQDTIPPGYVAHARDHCVDVDIHWDSMKPPQNWGDGGKYGEEWSAMHRRFRYGLDSMVNWYRHHIESSHQRHGHLRTLHPPAPSEDEDEDTDTVLILVSHGAGCNALIGALTNQPVLLDIGMASLTMAVRRERPLSPPPPTSPTGRRPSTASAEAALSHEYEVALTASTDHLRGSSSSSQASSPVDIAAPTSLSSLAPGLLQRSNTLPIRPNPTPHPPRHITPAPSKLRSTSLGKTSFASSPLNPNSSNGIASSGAPKTWMEAHQPQAQKSWMDAHRAERTAPTPAPVESKPTAAPPALFNGDSKKTASTGGGLWQSKAAGSGPGLWSRPSNIPRSGPGSAAVPPPAPAQNNSVQSRAAFVSPGAPTTTDHRLEQWMVEQNPKTNGSTNGPTKTGKTVTFAEPPKKQKPEESVSPRSQPAITDSDSDDHEGHQEEMSRWHDEVRAGEHAARIYKTPSEIRLHELGMKRRWTMNDERNQEKEKEGDWRMEAWM